MTHFVEVFGEFLRESLLQTAYLRYEVVQLKGKSEAEALARSVSFLGQNFETVHEMLEIQDISWARFESDIRERVKEMAEGENDPNRI